MYCRTTSASLFASVRLFAALLLVLVAPLGCSDSTTTGQNNGFELCGEAGPTCLVACNSDMTVEPSCEGGQWHCPADSIAAASCDDPPDEACTGTERSCVESCGDDGLYSSVCKDGQWQCPEGTFDTSTCPAETCWGSPAYCVETCHNGEFVEAVCGQTGAWSCPQHTIEEFECPDEPCEVTSTSTIPGVTIEFLGERCQWPLSEAMGEVESRYRVVVEDTVEFNPYAPGGGHCFSPADSGLIVRGQISDGLQTYCRCDFGLCASHDPEWTTLEPGIYYDVFNWAAYEWSGPSDTGQEYGDSFTPGTYTATMRTRGQIRREDGSVEDVEASSNIRIELHGE